MKHRGKRNQMMIVGLAVMIAIAGYLNYSGTFFKIGEKTKEANAEVGEKNLLDVSEEDVLNDEDEIEGVPGEAVLTNGVADATLAQAKVSREQVRAQNLETLQKIIDNENITEEEKQDAIGQMVQTTQLTEQENTIETLIAAKGFTDVVVNLTNESADVVVKAEELTDANRAQIEDIVIRKTEIAPENIVITPIQK